MILIHSCKRAFSALSAVLFGSTSRSGCVSAPIDRIRDAGSIVVDQGERESKRRKISFDEVSTFSSSTSNLPHERNHVVAPSNNDDSSSSSVGKLPSPVVSKLPNDDNNNGNKIISVDTDTRIVSPPTVPSGNNNSTFYDENNSIDYGNDSGSFQDENGGCSSNVNLAAIEKELALFTLDKHKTTIKRPLRDGEYDIVVQRTANSFGIILWEHNGFYTRCSGSGFQHDNIVIDHPFNNGGEDDPFLVAIQGEITLHLSFSSILEKVRMITSQQVAIRLQRRDEFKISFQLSLQHESQQTKRFTSAGISTLFRITSSSGDTVISLASEQLDNLMKGATYSNVTVTNDATNPIDLKMIQCSRIASVNNIPVALLELKHLKRLLRNQGVSTTTLKGMDLSGILQYILANASEQMIHSDSPIKTVEKVPPFLAKLGNDILSGDYSDVITLSERGVITVLDLVSFDTIIKNHYGISFDVTKFIKEMKQHGFYQEDVNSDRIAVIIPQSQIVFTHASLHSCSISDLFLCKREVTRSASPTLSSTTSGEDDEGVSATSYALAESGSDWSNEHLRDLYRMKHIEKQSFGAIAATLGRTASACKTKWYRGKPNDNDCVTADEFVGMCKLVQRVETRISEFDGMKHSDYWKHHNKRDFLEMLLLTLPPGMCLIDFVNGVLQLCHINADKQWNKRIPSHGHMSLHPSNFVLWPTKTNISMGELTHLSRVFVNMEVGFINDPDGQHWEHGMLQYHFPCTARDHLRVEIEKKFMPIENEDAIDNYDLYKSVTTGPKLEYDGTTVKERNIWMDHWANQQKEESTL